jgi:ABC-2 type transport system permease protein
MRREGSPWQGLSTVLLKELADYFDSARMPLLALVMVLAAAVPFLGAVEQLRTTTSEDPFLLLKLFNPGGQTLSVLAMLGWVIPVMAIGLGFDAVNGEHNRRTLSRILAQPIYRDALLAGKFLAGIVVLAVNLICLWLLVIGFGLYRLGVPPSADDFARSLVFLFIVLAYSGTWLGMAMLLSVLFRSPATSALLALGVWLLVTFLWPLMARYVAEVIAPSDPRFLLVLGYDPQTRAWEQGLSLISPYWLFEVAAQTILTPTTPSFGPVLDQLAQLRGVVVGATLPLRESLVTAWPQILGLVAGAIGLFVVTYVAFQRQEVRA